jgi:3-phenylpropionate/cinnamic acid dioxygenase small subunit
MALVKNVSIRDATHQIANNLEGNLECNYLLLYAQPGVAEQLLQGAFYTAIDTTTTWKVMYRGIDGQFLKFDVTEG